MARDIKDPNVRVFFDKAGQAYRNWAKANFIDSRSLAETLEIDPKWLIWLSAGKKRLDPSDLDNLAILYAHTGIQEFNPTLYPDETQESRSVNAGPMVIRRAWPAEKLTAFLETWRKNRPQPNPEEPAAPANPEEGTLSQPPEDQPEPAVSPSHPADDRPKRHTSSVDVPTMQEVLRDQLRIWMAANGTSTGLLADQLGIDRFTMYNITRARRLHEALPYALINARTGLASADPTTLPYENKWTQEQWSIWQQERGQQHSPLLASADVVSAPEVTQGDTVVTEAEAILDPAVSAESSDPGSRKVKNPHAVRISQTIKRYCDDNGISPYNVLARKLKLPDTIWTHMLSGNGFTDPKWYAELFLETGLSDFDPRLVPPPRRIPLGSTGRVMYKPNAWSQNDWVEWFNNQSQDRRNRFLALPGEEVKTAAETTEAPAPTTPPAQVAQALTTVPAPAIQATSAGALFDQLLVAAVQTAIAGTVPLLLAEIKQAVADSLPKLSEDLEALIDLRMEAITARIAQRPQAAAPAPRLTTLDTFLELAIKRLKEELLTAPPDKRDAFLTDHRNTVGELLALVQTLTQQKERRNEAIQQYIARNRR